MKVLSGKRVSYQSQKFCKNKNKNKQKGPTFKKGRCLQEKRKYLRNSILWPMT